ncbi:hypothetical protein LRP88_00092 [Fusarium phalaenopsidis]
MPSKAFRRRPTPQKIIDALKKHSPESTLSAADLRPPADISDVPPEHFHSLPRINICCGCMCWRLGLICECNGEGCVAGFLAGFEMKNGRFMTTIEPPTPVPLPINRTKTLKNIPDGFTKYMAPQAHDIDKQLEEQVKNGLRNLVRAHNEAVAHWLSGSADEAWSTFDWDNYFVDLEPQTQMVVKSIQAVITTSLNQYQTALLIPIGGSHEDALETVE